MLLDAQMPEMDYLPPTLDGQGSAPHSLPQAPMAQGLGRLQGGMPLLYEQQETGANARRTAGLSSTYAMGPCWQDCPRSAASRPAIFRKSFA